MNNYFKKYKIHKQTNWHLALLKLVWLFEVVYYPAWPYLVIKWSECQPAPFLVYNFFYFLWTICGQIYLLIKYNVLNHLFNRWDRKILDFSVQQIKWLFTYKPIFTGKINCSFDRIGKFWTILDILPLYEMSYSKNLIFFNLQALDLELVLANRIE